VPDWVDRNESDPGVTIVELLAWLAAGLLVALYVYRRWRPGRA